MSEATIQDYAITLRRFQQKYPDKEIEDVTARDVRVYLNQFDHVSKKTLLNYWIGLSSAYTFWLREGLVETHIMRLVDKARPKKVQPVPFEKGDIEKILASLKGVNAMRNRAIIFMLLDTGIRNTEMCELTINCLDGNHITVVKGKGDKTRRLPFSRDTGRLLVEYLYVRPHGCRNIFVTRDGGPLNRSTMTTMFKRIGQRARVRPCNCHRFRHTFAINYLRNGGDAFTLMALLGHATLDMTRQYCQIAQIDLDAGHLKASPVQNWRLLSDHFGFRVTEDAEVRSDQPGG